jgi:hypothetical protein
MPISECVNGCVTNDRLGLVRLANLTVTKVRQRMAREQLGHRGRKGDLAWAHRMLLLRAGDRLSARALRRLDHVFARDDPTGEIGAAAVQRLGPKLALGFSRGFTHTAVPQWRPGAVGLGMTHQLYERDLGSLYLDFAPAHLDDDEAALALIAHFTDISTARVKHALACRHFVTTGDRTRIDAYFRADDIGPDQDFTPETVAAARQQVEPMRMLEWEITGAHPGDTDPDTA